jgi:ankyrin repeat protein
MRGCDPCCQDNDGYTAAHYAVERNEIEHLKALTARFFSRVKPIPEQQATAIHDACLKALTLRENHGLTPFMLCVNQESMKCLDYLLELNINDVNLHVCFILFIF